MNQNAQNQESRLNPGRTDLSNNTHLFSRFRRLNLAKNSIGSLFRGPTSGRDSLTDGSSQNDPLALIEETKFQRMVKYDTLDFCDEDLTPTGGETMITGAVHQSNLATNRTKSKKDDSSLTFPPNKVSSAWKDTHISPRFPEVKKMFNNLTRSPSFGAENQHQQQRLPLPSSASGERRGSTWKTSGSTFSISSAVASVYGSDLETPPLTPDLFDDSAFVSPITRKCRHSLGHVEHVRVKAEYDDDDDEKLQDQSRSFEIKEGKRPELTSLLGPPTQGGSVPEHPSPEEVNDDQGEWFGLEYTLELSSRERHPSNTQSFSTGEHSRSRESWAALHQGSIHPFFEDEEYHHWKNWRRLLDRQDERKRHQKGWAFREMSEHLAWLYVDEMNLRGILFWQKEMYGMVSSQVKERLAYIAEFRPDPYGPKMKHNLGWYLKRSRSISCLDELQPGSILMPLVEQVNETTPNYDDGEEEDDDEFSLIELYQNSQNGYCSEIETGSNDGFDLDSYFSED